MISDGEIRATLESVGAKSENPWVRRVMGRAVEILDGRGFEAAAVELLREIARTKRVQRQLLWVNLAVAAVFIAILYLALEGFWKSI